MEIVLHILLLLLLSTSDGDALQLETGTMLARVSESSPSWSLIPKDLSGQEQTDVAIQTQLLTIAEFEAQCASPEVCQSLKTETLLNGFLSLSNPSTTHTNSFTITASLNNSAVVTVDFQLYNTTDTVVTYPNFGVFIGANSFKTALKIENWPFEHSGNVLVANFFTSFSQVVSVEPSVTDIIGGNFSLKNEFLPFAWVNDNQLMSVVVEATPVAAGSDGTEFLGSLYHVQLPAFTSSLQYVAFQSFPSATSSTQCPNDCFQQGACREALDSNTNNTTYTCECFFGWTGVDCSVRTAAHCNPSCGSQGWCDTTTDVAVCRCNSGWSGVDCSIGPCLNGCSGRGQCIMEGATPTCRCDRDYAGEDCSTPVEVAPAFPSDSSDGEFSKAKSNSALVWALSLSSVIVAAVVVIVILLVHDYRHKQRFVKRPFWRFDEDDLATTTIQPPDVVVVPTASPVDMQKA